MRQQYNEVGVGRCAARRRKRRAVGRARRSESLTDTRWERLRSGTPRVHRRHMPATQRRYGRGGGETRQKGALRAALDEAEAAVGAATAREAERAARAPALRARIEALRVQGRRADEATR